ncbi:MAG: T9SS type A sorting domain-containing protein [Saprospiraceae bacterium]|nr:T9SS type A sorting domain-containing protein [Saprospiraceae bacterium]
MRKQFGGRLSPALLKKYAQSPNWDGEKFVNLEETLMKVSVQHYFQGNYETYREQTGGYLAGCDIVCFDIYPVNNADTLTSEKLWYVPKGIDSLLAWAAAPKPTFAWIETTYIDASGNRGPTPAEVKSEVWMAIIHGATGIGYFCHSWTPVFDDAALLHDAVMIDSVRSINAWIDALAPVLNSPTISGYTSVSSSNATIPIHFMTKFYDNATYIFAVAMRPGTTTAAFTVPVGASIEVLGENRQLYESGGQFTDDFSEYGVHIYKIPALSSVEDVLDQGGLFVYPNPGKGVFHISSSPDLKNRVVRVSDQRGREVHRTFDAETFDLSGQPPGWYFVTIQTDREVVVIKIVLD